MESINHKNHANTLFRIGYGRNRVFYLRVRINWQAMKTRRLRINQELIERDECKGALRCD